MHVSLTKNLLQCAGLDVGLSRERTQALEEQRRVFWSVSALNALCGLQPRVPSLIEDIHNPRYLIMDDMLKPTSTNCPLLPQESHNDYGEKALGIWAHMARSATLWGEVRSYVARCSDGTMKSPWQPDSPYTVINSHLFDMECAFPQSYRYDVAKFPDRTIEEIHEKRNFWLPWMKIQVTYHTIHALLNHPFLYSSRPSKPRPGPNAFWKTSTDLAILHSTWVARLIAVSEKKRLNLSDPFFAYAAAAAATLHLYWSRASHASVRHPAQKNLEICRSLISELAAHWPICREIVGSNSW
jgi:hypothetical protein